MSVVYPTKYKQEQKSGTAPKVLPSWSMKKDYRGATVELSEIKPPSPYPPNRRKPGVVLPIPGGIKPFKLMLDEECPDKQKDVVKSLKEVEPRADKGNGKGKKNKKAKKK